MTWFAGPLENRLEPSQKSLQFPPKPPTYAARSPTASLGVAYTRSHAYHDAESANKRRFAFSDGIPTY
ncbi:MAG: hypothetical protein ABI999_18415 [Acidobacteriota bacterium]